MDKHQEQPLKTVHTDSLNSIFPSRDYVFNIVLYTPFCQYPSRKIFLAHVPVCF